MLIKLLAIVVAVWFYKQAKKVGENGIQWAFIGLVGYAIVVAIVVFAIAKPILAGFHTPPRYLFLLLNHLLPPAAGIIACFFVNKRLIKQSAASKQ